MQLPPNNQIDTKLHQILEMRHLTETTFVMRLERNQLVFKTGQHINVGPANSIHTREYSVYSGEADPYLEILVKEVLDGYISPALKNHKPGDQVQVEEATGYFSLPRDWKRDDRLLFIASGTGIAPFHSFIRSYPQLDYQLLHGIRFLGEQYEAGHYSPERYLACTSRESSGNTFPGRVTEYLKKHPVKHVSRCFLCGSSDMIHDVYDILEEQGFPIERIHAEVYF